MSKNVAGGALSSLYPIDGPRVLTHICKRCSPYRQFTQFRSARYPVPAGRRSLRWRLWLHGHCRAVWQSQRRRTRVDWYVVPYSIPSASLIVARTCHSCREHVKTDRGGPQPGHWHTQHHTSVAPSDLYPCSSHSALAQILSSMGVTRSWASARPEIQHTSRHGRPSSSQRDLSYSYYYPARGLCTVSCRSFDEQAGQRQTSLGN